jgi:hypothetical protein
VAFGLPWNDRESTPPCMLEPAELLFEVRVAAENLVDDIQLAEKLTRDWADKKLTDVLIDAALSRAYGSWPCGKGDLTDFPNNSI